MVARTNLIYRGRYRHAQHYLQELRVANILYQQGGEQSARAVEHFATFWSQVQHGHTWAVSCASQDEDALHLCKDYPRAGVDILSAFQPLPERIAWLEMGLSAAEQLSDHRAAVDHLIKLGKAYQLHGQRDRSLGAWEQAQQLAQRIDYSKGEASAHLGSGRVLQQVPADAPIAREHLEAALHIYENLSDQIGIGLSLNSLASLEEWYGDLKQARQYSEQALDIVRKVGNSHHIADSLERLASIVEAQGEYDTAQQYAQEALSLARQLADKNLIVRCLCQLGLIFDLQNNPQPSWDCYEEGLKLARVQANQFDISICLMNLGWMAAHREAKFDQAEKYLEEALVISRSMNDLYFTADLLDILTLVHLEQGKTDFARTNLCESIQHSLTVEATDSLLQSTAAFGWLMLLEGQPEQGAELIGLVTHHPNFPRLLSYNREQIDRIHAKLQAALPPEQFQAALERGAKHTLQETVRRLCQQQEI